MQNIKTEILNRIESENIKMKSKLHFILKSILIWTLLILFLIMCIYFISLFTFLSSEANEKLHNPEIFTLIKSMDIIAPIAIVLSVASFVLAEYISKKYTFAYRTHLIYSLITLGGLVIVSSMVVNRYNIHPFMRERMEMHNIHFPPRPRIMSSEVIIMQEIRNR